MRRNLLGGLLIMVLALAIFVGALTDEEYNECKDKIYEEIKWSSLYSFERSCNLWAERKCFDDEKKAKEFCDILLVDTTTPGPELVLNDIDRGLNEGASSGKLISDEERCQKLAERLSEGVIKKYEREHPRELCEVESRVDVHVNQAGVPLKICEWRVRCSISKYEDGVIIDSHFGGFKGNNIGKGDGGVVIGVAER